MRWRERTGRRLGSRQDRPDPLAYLRADELAGWGLILRVPARKRDRIAGNDADDRRAHSFTPSGRLSLRATLPETGLVEGSAWWPFVTNRPFPCSESPRYSAERSCLLKLDSACRSLPVMPARRACSCDSAWDRNRIRGDYSASGCDIAADTGPTPYHPTAPAFGGFWLGESRLNLEIDR